MTKRDLGSWVEETHDKSRLGVFVCHCGHNIASKVDVEHVVEQAAEFNDVVFASHSSYMCSEPGQKLIRDSIKTHNLDGIVVAACSVRLHENTFRKAAQDVGLNEHRVEIANIREHCAWIHGNSQEATAKALRIVKMTSEKAKRNKPLNALSMPVKAGAVVVGAGIAGIQAALDIAEGGQEVWLVERESSVGGNMARLSETFPTLDCAQCTLTPKMVAVSRHKNIHLLNTSEVVGISGHIGDFKVTIKRRARYVNWDVCTGCGACIEVCPSKVPSEFDLGMINRKAIFTPFLQAVPNKPTIDPLACLRIKSMSKGRNACGLCEKACSVGAIDFFDKEETIELNVGALVIATGYQTYAKEKITELYPRLPDVIDGLQFERLLSASGPTAGELLRPSNGEPIKSIAFLHCAGSRDKNHKAYCSKICCMYLSKHAMLFKHRVPDGRAWSFYIDRRHAGRDYEEFLVRTEESGINFIRGKAADIKLAPNDDPEIAGKLQVRAEDTLTHKLLEVPVDLVVMATPIEPSFKASELAANLKLAQTPDGFMAEAHMKLRPVESMTAGFFLAGACQGPKDIPESVAQASAAASKVLGLLSKELLTGDPTIAIVNQNVCVACGHCMEICPVDARSLIDNKLIVDEALCQCCGACAPACPTGAADMLNFTDLQIMSMIDSMQEVSV